MDWLEKGYYQRQAADVAKQFLVDSMFTMEQAASFPSTKLSMPELGDGLRASMDTIAGCPYYPLIRTLSFSEFLDTRIDVIMVTLADNQEPWLRLRDDLKPNAKLLREEGNVCGWASINLGYHNVLTSDVPTFHKCRAKNKLLYHQRFDTQSIFSFEDVSHFDRISCFMPGFRGCPELIQFAESHDFGSMQFVDFGHFSKRGYLNTKQTFVEAMKRTTFVWQVKPGGDGFGHVIHNSFAVGRPVITGGDHYRGSLAGLLLEDGKTCIMIGQDPIENSRKIRSMSDPQRIRSMGRAAHTRFLETVHYDRERDAIQAFLQKLV